MENTYLDIIKGRRSIFPENFSEEEIRPEEVRQLLEAVRYAPTHKLTQPWRFRVYMGAQKKELAEAVGEHITEVLGKKEKAVRTEEKFDRSRAILVVSYVRDVRERVPEWEELAATVMAVENLWMYSKSLDMGGYFSTGKGAVNALKEYIRQEEREKIIGLFYLGKTRHEPRVRPAKEVDDFTTWFL